MKLINGRVCVCGGFMRGMVECSDIKGGNGNIRLQRLNDVGNGRAGQGVLGRDS